MRTFVYTDAKSNKFWNIELKGKAFTVTFGRVGTAGQTQTKDFASPAAAKAAHDKLVAEKVKKGYAETTDGPAAPSKPAVATEQKALEAALVAHPDELAAHSAYADYLTEAGDPRGEFIQTQLALEDEARTKPERDELRKRETALLRKHARRWLGDTGRFLVGKWSGPDKPYSYRFARGWLDFVRVLPVPEAVVSAVANAPEARLLRRLEVVYDMRYHPFDFEEFTSGPEEQLRDGEKSGEIYDAFATLPYLVESPHLGNLRVFKYGFSDDHSDAPSYSTMVDPFNNPTAERFLEFLQQLPRLEELYLNLRVTDIDSVFSAKCFGNLRVFQYYYGSAGWNRRNTGDAYPLSTLARNKSFGNLTTLRLHPGRDATIDLDELTALLRSKHFPALAHLQVHMTTFGDDGATAIVKSGILKRLKTLDIGYGNMTDAGARVLAASPDLKALGTLDVSQNALTDAGVAALRASGVTVVADAQHGIGGEDDDMYLFEVDRE